MSEKIEITTRYYIARRSRKGKIELFQEEVGPYYDKTVLVRKEGYKTREDALNAMIEAYKWEKDFYQYNRTVSYFILEETTIGEED